MVMFISNLLYTQIPIPLGIFREVVNLFNVVLICPFTKIKHCLLRVHNCWKILSYLIILTLKNDQSIYYVKTSYLECYLLSQCSIQTY